MSNSNKHAWQYHGRLYDVKTKKSNRGRVDWSPGKDAAILKILNWPSIQGALRVNSHLKYLRSGVDQSTDFDLDWFLSSIAACGMARPSLEPLKGLACLTRLDLAIFQAFHWLQIQPTRFTFNSVFSQFPAGRLWDIHSFAEPHGYRGRNISPCQCRKYQDICHTWNILSLPECWKCGRLGRRRAFHILVFKPLSHLFLF